MQLAASLANLIGLVSQSRKEAGVSFLLLDLQFLHLRSLSLLLQQTFWCLVCGHDVSEPRLQPSRPRPRGEGAAGSGGAGGAGGGRDRSRILRDRGCHVSQGPPPPSHG